MTVVKVGGSLLDWPELGLRLRTWLAACVDRVVLIPGGGPTTDVIRGLDQRHGLGEERAHWLALRALTLNAHFLVALLPDTEVVADLADMVTVWQAGRTPILDAYALLLADEARPGALTHTWAAGSDLVALRAAALLGARRLVLVKSISVPEDLDWEERSRRGLIDGDFAATLQTLAGLEVQVVNLRELAPSG
jgi:5-(aminomethyl)-3-furanmethanol phosphate kinase